MTTSYGTCPFALMVTSRWLANDGVDSLSFAAQALESVVVVRARALRNREPGARVGAAGADVATLGLHAEAVRHDQDREG